MGLFDGLFKKQGIPDKLNIGGKEYKVNPDAMVFSQMGLDNYQNGNYTAAITAFSKAISAQPQNQNFYLMRGTSYEDAGNDIDAGKDFRKALELSPNEFVAAYRLGMVYFRAKDFENAIKWLKISYENGVDGDDKILGTNNILFIAKKIVAGNLGNFLTQVKRYEEGFKYLDAAIKLDPSYSNPYMSKGLAFVQMGKPENGLPYIKRAAELGNPKASGTLQIVNDIINKSKRSNPLNIIDDAQLNRLHRLPNLVASFANDLSANFQILQDNSFTDLTIEDAVELTVYYAIDLLIEYRDKAMNTLPSSIIEDVKNQVLQAAQNCFDVFNKQEVQTIMLSQIDKKIWDENIANETHQYMAQFQ